MARPRDGQRQHQGGEQDGDDLVGLGVDQKCVRGHVLDEVVGRIGRPATAVQRVEDEADPAGDRRQAGEHHEARLEAQCPQGDEQEHVEECRHLQIEDGRLRILVVERVDQAHQQQHVGDHRQIEHPGAQQARVGKTQAHQAEDAIDDQHVEFEGVILLHHTARHRARFVDRADQHHDGELHPADQDLALLLLAFDRLAHTVGKLGCLAAPEQPKAQAAEHQRFSSQRLAGSASGGRGRREITEAASRSAMRRSAQTLEKIGLKAPLVSSGTTPCCSL